MKKLDVLPTPKTLGEFREFTRDMPDDTHLGFMNQPIQGIVHNIDTIETLSFIQLYQPCIHPYNFVDEFGGCMICGKILK